MNQHETAKRAALEAALAHAGPRMSTVGPRVVPPGTRVALGSAMRADDAAHDVLRRERRPAQPSTKGQPHCPAPHHDVCPVRCGYQVPPETREAVHWSEARQ